MTLPIVLRTEASQDAEQSRDYLELQQPGLGQAFLNRLKESLARISVMPLLYGVVWRNIRAARLRKFTYVVYHRVHEHFVEVMAILHGSRDTREWKSRD